MRKSLPLPENARAWAFFALQFAKLSYAWTMRLVLTVMAAWLMGMPIAQAQFQLLPGSPAPARPAPAAKTAKPEHEPATRGNFPRRMKREEIEALFFTGEPVEATGLGRASFRVTFLKDGMAERLNHKDGTTERGKWRFLGDGYCSKWGKSHEGCYTIVKDGDTYKVVRGTRAVAFWSPPGTEKKLPSPAVLKQEPPVAAAPMPPAQQEQQEAAPKGDLPLPPENETDSDEDEEQSEEE
jgi:hypothetical protein